MRTRTDSVADLGVDSDAPAVAMHNGDARGAFVVTCDHASNAIPERYRSLGLAPADLQRHIAWDIGALAVSGLLARQLDAPLLHPTASRLLLDVNRAPDAHDAIPLCSEDTDIPGNRDLDDAERRHRRDWIYTPYHDAIAALVARRIAARQPTALLSIHSFTPVYHGEQRPWQAGVLSHRDRRMADPLLAALRDDPTLRVGDNQPYVPSHGVYHTLDRHAEAHGLPCVMIEIRNDLIADAVGQRAWAERLAPLLQHALHEASPVES